MIHQDVVSLQLLVSLDSKQVHQMFRGFFCIPASMYNMAELKSAMIICDNILSQA